MPNKYLFSRLSSVFLLVSGLSQCAEVSETHLQVNGQLASHYTRAASVYLDAASQQGGYEKQNALIHAAGRMIYDGQRSKGLAILSQTAELTPDQSNEKYLLLAKTELMRERHHSALARLSSIRQINEMPLYYQVQYHEMLATAYQGLRKETESVNERMKLEAILPDESSRTNNRRALWLSLTKLPAPELNALAVEASEDPGLEGWLRLALISRQNAADSTKMIEELTQWKALYPNHPANRILPSSLSSVAATLHKKPQSMALLLPLSGPLAGPGGAVRDGFVAENQRHAHPVTIKTYDTAKGGVVDIYKQALADGADYIVGPLSKSDVSIVAGMNHPVPTLLLNEPDVHISDNGYQFALSPVDEARQVASKARQSGYSRALIIAPQGAWSAEVIEAFSNQWSSNGGKITDRLFYDKQDDLNVKIADFLHISESQAREAELKKLLGKQLQSIPRRRQDFDVIFLLAYPSKARQIMPLLKYYYAGDVPVYGTSTVFAGTANTMKDRDLDGIIFCDMPWMFVNQKAQGHWPEQLNSYNRLFALGTDSYALATQLNELKLFPAMGTHDKSGVLFMKSNHKVGRILEWGQFKQGLAKALTETA